MNTYQEIDYETQTEEIQQEEIKVTTSDALSEAIHLLVNNEIRELTKLADVIKEEYIDRVETLASIHKFQPRYFPIIQSDNDGLFIYWKDYIKRNTVTKAMDFKKAKKIFGDTVKMPKRGYTPKNFKGTYSQEQELILKMEERFELIRNKVMHLKKVTFYSKLASKNDLSDLLELYED